MRIDQNDKSNFDTAVKQLADSFIAAEIDDNLTQAIDKTVQESRSIFKKFQQSKERYTAYNESYIRTMNYFNEIQSAKGKDISQEALDIKIDTITHFDNYRISKLEEDQNVITSLYDYMNELAKKGYENIMHLRELLTGQRIIYAIEHIDKNISYQQFLSGEEYLDLFVGQRSRDLKKMMEIKRPSHFAVTLNTKAAMGNPTQKLGMDITHSHDWAYQRLAKITESKTNSSGVIKNNERWELYTEMRSYFSNYPSSSDGPSDLEFNNYLQDFLVAKEAWLKRISTKGKIISSQKNKWFQMSTLAFYQGGDSVYTETILIQNKSTGAAIRVGTIYNGLSTIINVFKDFPSLSVEQVKTLFTANLQDLPNQIINAGFKKANKYAQNEIEKRIAALKKS